MLHAKMILCDDWVSIGSSNSIAGASAGTWSNQEIADARVADAAAAMFEGEDFAASRLLSRRHWTAARLARSPARGGSPACSTVNSIAGADVSGFTVATVARAPLPAAMQTALCCARTRTGRNGALACASCVHRRAAPQHAVLLGRLECEHCQRRPAATRCGRDAARPAAVRAGWASLPRHARSSSARWATHRGVCYRTAMVSSPAADDPDGCRGARGENQRRLYALEHRLEVALEILAV